MAASGRAFEGEQLSALALGPMPGQDAWSPRVRLRRSPPTLPKWTPRPPNLLWVERRWRAGQAGRALPAPDRRSGPWTGVREGRLFESVAWRSPMAWIQLSSTADRTSIPPGWAYLWGRLPSKGQKATAITPPSLENANRYQRLQ